MDTLMNADNTNQATAYGEYPVSSSTNVASSSAEAIPTSTEGFAQYDTTTNEIGLDTQVNTNTDFQALTNFGGDDNDFASVNILSSDESSNVQVGGFEATTTTNTNVDFTASTQVDTNMNFDTNAQIDFGTTNTTSEMDVLQATSGNTETQYGEYQATSPIIDTAESAQIVENTSIEGNMNFNADTFQSVEPNVEMENNNFDFTTNNSIVGATSALNNFETTSTNFDINNIDFTASTPAVDTNTNFEINTTTAETTYGQTDLTHELVDPNPIETNVNFSTQAPTTEQTFDTTTNVDINTFAETSAEPVVDTTLIQHPLSILQLLLQQNKPLIQLKLLMLPLSLLMNKLWIQLKLLMLPLLLQQNKTLIQLKLSMLLLSLKVNQLLIQHQPSILPLLLQPNKPLIQLKLSMLPLSLKVNQLLILLHHLI